MSISSDFLLR